LNSKDKTNLSKNGRLFKLVANKNLSKDLSNRTWFKEQLIFYYWQPWRYLHLVISRFAI